MIFLRRVKHNLIFIVNDVIVKYYKSELYDFTFEKWKHSRAKEDEEEDEHEVDHDRDHH